MTYTEIIQICCVCFCLFSMIMNLGFYHLTDRSGKKFLKKLDEYIIIKKEKETDMKKKIKAEEYSIWDKNIAKELTPLEHLGFIRNYEIDDEHRTLNMNYATKQSLDIIELALKDYEELKKLKLFPYPKVNDEEYRRSVIKRLQAFEIIKEYFVLTSEYGKVSLEPKKEIPDEQYDLLEEVLKDD